MFRASTSRRRPLIRAEHAWEEIRPRAQNRGLSRTGNRMNAENRPLILCIDDGEIPLRVRKLLLSGAGYTVLTSESAEQGLDLFRQNPVELVIADHYLSETTGTEIAKQMKQLKPEVPILIFSAAAEEPPGLEFADGFLSKGESPDFLLQVIASLLKK